MERVLEDVPEDEQRALRAAALLPYFDSDIVAATAGVDDGCALRAMSRPMIDHRGSRVFPYTMHDTIREAIRRSGHDIPNGWSDRDWKIAGAKALRAVRIRYEAAMARHEAGEALEALGLAIILVCDQELMIDPAPSPDYADWVSQAIVFGPSIVGLRSTLPATARTRFGKGIIDFVLARTTEVEVDDAVKLLIDLFESNHPLRLPAGRHCGYVLRNAYRFDEAIAAFDNLVAVAPTIVNRYQQLFTYAAARRFQDALDKMGDLPDNRVRSIRRACAAPHGRFDGWFEPQFEHLAELRERGRAREAIEEAGNTYRWRAFVHGDVDVALLEQVQEEAEEAVHLTGLRDIYLAKLFIDPDSANRDRDALAWVEKVDRSRNSGEIGFRTSLARIALGLFTRSHDALDDIATEINARPLGRDRMWIPSECLLDSYGYSITIPSTQWLEPYERVRDRWRELFDLWLQRVHG